MSLNKLLRLLAECETLEIEQAPPPKFFIIDRIMMNEEELALAIEAAKQAKPQDLIVEILHDDPGDSTWQEEEEEVIKNLESKQQFTLPENEAQARPLTQPKPESVTVGFVSIPRKPVIGLDW